jgi:ribosomal protein S27AE
MSSRGYGRRGGMEHAIVATDEELQEFAKFLSANNVDKVRGMDSFMPIPEMNTQQQLNEIRECCGDDADMAEHVSPEYFERPNGSHGWSCSRCGYVVQWG